MSEIQVKFMTKNEIYAIPDVSYVIPGTSDSKNLNSLIKSVLGLEGETEEIQFSFFVNGNLLRSSIITHLEEKDISSEALVEIEYVLKCQAPSPETSLIHDDWVSSVKISDGNNWILTGCYDNTVHIWDVNGSHKLTIPGHVAPVKAVTWVKIEDPICSFVSTSHDETSIIWEWNQKTNAVECAHICKGHSRSVDCVDVEQEEYKIVTGSYDQTLKVWSTSAVDIFDPVDEDADKKKLKTQSGRSKTKTPLLTLSGHIEGITGIQWIHSKEICSCSLDSTLRLWDVELGGLKSQLNGSKSFLDLSYSPLSKNIVTASTDRHVRLWDSRMNSATLVKAVFSSHDGWVTSVKWSPLNEYLFISGSFDQLLKFWDVRSPQAPLFDLSGHEDRIFCTDWSSSNHIASGGADCHVKIYKGKE